MAKIELDASKIELLLRAALLDDAANTSERFGALLAEISVDDDGDACVCLAVDFWPEEKEPKQIASVAKLLGIEVELAASDGEPPFHWPGLAQETQSTAEYVSILLDAYAGRNVDLRRQ